MSIGFEKEDNIYAEFENFPEKIKERNKKLGKGDTNLLEFVKWENTVKRFETDIKTDDELQNDETIERFGAGCGTGACENNSIEHFENKNGESKINLKKSVINQKVSSFYDNDFNNKYERIQAINKDINTKDAVINMNRNSYQDKELTVFSLKNLLYLILYIILIGTFMVVGVISYGSFTTMVLVGIIAYVIRVFQYGRRRTPTFEQEIKELNRATVKGFGQALAKNLLPKYMYKCPKKCKKKKEPEDVIPGYPPLYDKFNELITDSSLNSWLNGDKPEAKYDTTGANTVEGRDKPSPSPAYGGLSEKSATKYKCRIGGRVVNTYIPCKYYLHYLNRDQSETETEL